MRGWAADRKRDGARRTHVAPRLHRSRFCRGVARGRTRRWEEHRFATAIELAGRRGFVVLTCRPAEAEATLSVAGLGDLLADVVETAMKGLPPLERLADVRPRPELDRLADAPRPRSCSLALGGGLMFSSNLLGRV